MLIDTMDSTVEEAYSGWPDRIYIVTTEGKIGYKGDPGPGGFDPQDMERCLIKLLNNPK